MFLNEPQNNMYRIITIFIYKYITITSCDYNIYKL